MRQILSFIILTITITQTNAENLMGDRIFFDSFEPREGVILNGHLVNNWFYFLGFEPTETELQKMIDSQYDMVVLEPIFTDESNTDYAMAAHINQLHNASHTKLAIAYIDIGQAEDWRTYWQPDWGIGNPSWIVANDPDGWEGNYPVAYWHPQWQDIWLNPINGYLVQMIDAGFDGIYLDWIEAYSDENVITAAQNDGVNPQVEMIEFIEKMKILTQSLSPGFTIIGQNATELVEDNNYVAVIDAIAQEQTWFDGSATNNPPGDCPLPATDADIDTPAYYDSLSPACQEIYNDFPDSTLHVSTESYLYYLNIADSKGIPVFTVDYAVQQDNIDAVYTNSKNLGYIPFVGERALANYIEVVD